MSEEMNRKMARQIAQNQALHKEARDLLEECIFTELQIAEKRGEVVAKYPLTIDDDAITSGNVPEATVEDVRLSRERGLELTMNHPVFAMIAVDLAAMLDEAGEVNYVEYTVRSERHGLLNVRIQKAEGETPAQQNVQLRKRIAELEAESKLVAEIRRVIAEHRTYYKERTHFYREHGEYVTADQCEFFGNGIGDALAVIDSDMGNRSRDGDRMV